MSLPTEGEEFAKLIEHLRKAQEAAAMIAHLSNDKSKIVSRGWLAVEEHFKKLQHTITQMAVRKMQ